VPELVPGIVGYVEGGGGAETEVVVEVVVVVTAVEVPIPIALFLKFAKVLSPVEGALMANTIPCIQWVPCIQ